MSEEWSYCFSRSETSGALYHRELIWLERLLFFFSLPFDFGLCQHLRSDHLPDFLGRVLLQYPVLADGLSDTATVTASGANAAVRQSSSKTEITDFDLAIFVNQDVRRLQITVQDIHRMQVLHRADQIVQNQHNVVF